jgi:hypothetical protein
MGMADAIQQGQQHPIGSGGAACPPFKYKNRQANQNRKPFFMAQET